ncbi:hypothetical protein DYB34_013375, partial [Aphanomyces astaci]
TILRVRSLAPARRRSRPFNLPPGHELSAYRVANKLQEVPEASLARLREDVFVKLAAARDQLHREAAKTSATFRDNERARRNKKPNVEHSSLTSEIMV